MEREPGNEGGMRYWKSPLELVNSHQEGLGGLQKLAVGLCIPMK